MTMADEVELKLELRPQDVDAFLSARWLGGASKIARQRSIYFDTPDQRLAQGGLSLRIRRSGRRRIQTIKANGAGAAGLFARAEWERQVLDDTPILDDATPLRPRLGEAIAELGPVFEVRVERHSWEITHGGATIELVLDRGAVVAGDRRIPVCEIELELKQGPVAALFALARKLDSVVPLRLGVLSKAERGYALIGPMATVFRAERLQLAPAMAAPQAFQHIVQACLRQYRLNEALLLKAHAPEPLHQARVALRRLRSAFSIFRSLVDDETSARLRSELRWLAAELGEARNLDVLLGRSQPGVVHEGLEAARQTTYRRIDEILASPRVRALMLDLVEWAAAGPWLTAAAGAGSPVQPAAAFAAVALDRLRRKVKKRGRHLAAADDETRHAVRKDAKKLRYAAEFFATLFDRKREQRRHRRFVAALERLQDDLGALNDLSTAPEVLTRLGLIDLPGAAALLASGSRPALLDSAEAAHEALVDAKRFWR